MTKQEIQKRYRERHKEQISKYNREYFQKNKEKIYAKRRETKLKKVKGNE